jgi:hypothetical protein
VKSLVHTLIILASGAGVFFATALQTSADETAESPETPKVWPGERLLPIENALADPGIFLPAPPFRLG